MPQSPHDPASPLALSVDGPGKDSLATTRVAAASSRIGTRLCGKWHLDALLGRGGSATVYAGTHRNGMRGAVKVLDRLYSRDPGLLARFLREGYIANKVDHIGAVRVLDDDVAEDGCAFLVMELLTGEALDERAASSGGRLGVQEVLWLTGQLLDALAAAHDKGIVHRDLKPDNLFLTTEGILKVLDFGLARIFEETEVPRSVTRSGSTMGTPAFMSPEQARGRWELVDGQSDLWSVGATMFSLLSGHFVHGEEGTAAEMIAAAFTKPARSLAQVMPEAPSPLVALVDSALVREKSERWLDARSMHAALSTTHEALFGGPLPPRPVPSGRPSDGMFSFTSSRPRTSLAPLREQPTLAPPGTAAAASLAPVFAPPRRRPRLAFVAASAAAMVGCVGVLALLETHRSRGAATSSEMAVALPEAPSVAMPGPSTAPATSVEVTVTLAVDADEAGAPAAEPAGSAHEAVHTTVPGWKRGTHAPSVPVRPAPAGPSTSLFDRRH